MDGIKAGPRDDQLTTKLRVLYNTCSTKMLNKTIKDDLYLILSRN